MSDVQASAGVDDLVGVAPTREDRPEASAAPDGDRAFFEQLFAQSSVSTQILDKDGWCERINPKLTELFGVKPEHIEGRVYNIFRDEGVRQSGVLPHLERVFREGRATEWEVFFDIGVAAASQHIDVRENVRRWFHNWAYPIFDASGALAHVIIQHVDVTARRRTTEALAASEARYRTLFEQSPDALMMLQPPEWHYGAVNPATVTMFGFEAATAFVGQAPWSFSPERQPDGRTSVVAGREMVERALREGAHQFEWTHRRASGEAFPATVLLARVDGEGLPLVQATVRDETEKRRLEASLAHQDRLASMGLLAAGVAHEINNPLAYVLASVEALAQKLPQLLATRPDGGASPPGPDAAGLVEVADAEELVEAARSALEGTRRIAKIARGLGSFARVDRSECAAVDLRSALESAVTMAHNELRYRATLLRDFAEVPAVWASAGKLSQVFLNLLINASHAIPDGDAGVHRITVRTWASGADVFAEVSDTGAGIAPEHLERIFEPFFTTKPAGKGSGLGLSICRTLLAEFGGELSAESTLGKGSRFVVRLPARPLEVAAPVAPPPSLAQPAVAARRGRVLVIDDEEAIRAVLHRVLRREHDVDSVGSGLEAQALLRRDTAFDVILCDLMMPGLSGIELHEWLVGHDPALARRLIFVSGGAFTTRATDYLARVENLQLEKPFDPAVLRQVVGDLVARGRPGG